MVLNNGPGISLGFAPTDSTCLRVSNNEEDTNINIICGLLASDARGVITRVLIYDGVISNDCPGDSGTTLISSEGPPLPTLCDHVVPRMYVFAS